MNKETSKPDCGILSITGGFNHDAHSISLTISFCAKSKLSVSIKWSLCVKLPRQGAKPTKPWVFLSQMSRPAYAQQVRHICLTERIANHRGRRPCLPAGQLRPASTFPIQLYLSIYRWFYRGSQPLNFAGDHVPCSMNLTNKDIGRLFDDLFAQLMELHGENEFKIRSYANAGLAIRKWTCPALSKPKEMKL